METVAVLVRIPKKEYEELQSNYVWWGRHGEYIKKGTKLPDNATNGDMIKALFPDAENIRVDNGLPLNFILEFELHRNYKDWWNSPYIGYWR